jgi:hypothetical protein
LGRPRPEVVEIVVRGGAILPPHRWVIGLSAVSAAIFISGAPGHVLFGGPVLPRRSAGRSSSPAGQWGSHICVMTSPRFYVRTSTAFEHRPAELHCSGSSVFLRTLAVSP